MITLNSQSITSPKETLTQLWQYYITTNKSQSMFHRDKVASLRYDVSTFNGDIEDLITRIDSSISMLFSTEFTTVETDTTYTPVGDTFRLNFSIIVYLDGEEYSVNEEISIREQQVLHKYELYELYNKGLIWKQ